MSVLTAEQILREVKSSTRPKNEVVINYLDRIKTVYGLITPALADNLILRNFKNNRDMNNSVPTLMRRIEDGSWMPDVSDITFDYHGELTNGQNTLTAISRSNKSVVARVQLGSNPDARYFFDNNTVRSGKAVTQIHGKIPRDLAGLAAKTCNGISRIASGANSKYDADKTFLPKFYEAYPEIVESAQFVKNVMNSDFHRAPFIVLHLLYSLVERQSEIERVLRVINTRDEDQQQHNAIHAFNKLYNDKILKKDKHGLKLRIDSTEGYTYLFRAVEDFLGDAEKQIKEFKRTMSLPSTIKKRDGSSIRLSDVFSKIEPKWYKIKMNHSRPDQKLMKLVKQAA